MIHLVILGKPFSKQRHQTSIRGKGENAYLHEWTPTQTVNYEVLVRLAFMEKYPDHVPWERDMPIVSIMEAFYAVPASIPKAQIQIALRGDVYRPRVNDIDNCLKVVWDALNQIAFADDNQIAEAHAYKFYSDKPRMELKLYTLEEYSLLQGL